MLHLAKGCMGRVQHIGKGDQPGGRCSPLRLGGGRPGRRVDSRRGATNRSRINRGSTLRVGMLASCPSPTTETWGPPSSKVPWALVPWEEALHASSTP
jgi:hypothetical protein